MKLRRVTDWGQKVQALVGESWVNLSDVDGLEELALEYGVSNDLETNMMAVLQLGTKGWAALNDLLAGVTPQNKQDLGISRPIDPASFRDFMLFEKHVIDSSRGYAKRFMPSIFPLTKTVENFIRKPFPMFKPHALWYQQPIYYLSNHLNFGVCGDEVSWPSYTNALDYELEIGAVLAKPLFNATAEEATDAIGGFVVLNDFSARDVQKKEMDSGFGPQKSKHFVSTMSSIIVTADEIIPNINNLKGTVTLNGAEVSQCHSGQMKYSMGEAIAFASKEEHLHAGELFGSGTMPGGSGMETGHWLTGGDTLTLSIDRIGTLTNTIGRRS